MTFKQWILSFDWLVEGPKLAMLALTVFPVLNASYHWINADFLSAVLSLVMSAGLSALAPIGSSQGKDKKP